MARRGRTGVKYEVDRALKEINHIGKSKKDARSRGNNGYIHSYKQREHDYSNAMEYGKWLRSSRGKGLYQANKTDYKDYIAHKSESCSKGHVINIETSLRHLSHGMNKVSDKHGRNHREWVPKDRVVSSRDRDKPTNRSYTPREVNSIREHLPSSGKTRDSLDMQNAFGMRLDEVSRATTNNFDTKGETTLLVIKDGDKIAKGGRGRTAPCRPEYEQQVREIITRNGGEGSGQFVGAKYETAKSAYRTAAEKADVNYNGSHGFRHSYARAELDRLLEERGIAENGREVIDRMLENKDNGLRKDAGFASEEKELYKEVNQVIDQLHEALGHGKGRIDLVAVYMSNQ
jgi:integrase